MRKLRTIEMHRLSVDEFKTARKLPIVIVLDNVRSAYNVGSVFRTCDAFRIERVCLCGISATPPNTEIHKTALGGEDSVDWTYFQDTADCISDLRAKGFRIWSVEQAEGSIHLPATAQDLLSDSGSSTISDLSQSELAGDALIFGNEVKGVRQDIVDMSDGCLEIPQYGTKHSLNVSVTAGIVIWEFAKRYISGESATL